jgi:hypothetical protein
MQAYPCAVGKRRYGAPVQGMEVRDYCAVRMAAMQFSESKTAEQAEEVIRKAYEWADLMCQIRCELHGHPSDHHET